MKKLLNYKLVVLILACFIGKTALAQTDTWTEKSAKEWADKGEWRNGFKPKLYAGIDYVEFAKQYHKNKTWWDKAFAYMNNTTRLDTLSPGKYPIDGDNAYATITDAETKPYDKTVWESHRKYLDLHLMIRGKERMGVMNPATAVVTDPYDDAKDVAHYDPATKGNYYVGDPETLMVFFPQNSHRPVIHVDGYDKVKKLVIKIRMAQ